MALGSRLRVAQAIGLTMARDPQAALAKLRDLAEVAPGSPDVREGFAQVELNRGRPRAAILEHATPSGSNRASHLPKPRFFVLAWKPATGRESRLLWKHCNNGFLTIRMSTWPAGPGAWKRRPSSKWKCSTAPPVRSRVRGRTPFGKAATARQGSGKIAACR